ncbi:MAG: hypothetical protein GEU90_22005 [Gemmatimonas sp.]|nr:hypothetical protein [Gemmatimonas sp.]
MSDRTSMSAIVYFDREPTAKERRRFAAISGRHDGEDWNLGDSERHSLGFGLQENVCGGSAEIFEQLCEGLPDAAEIVVWEDPKYGWLGQLFRWKQGQNKPFSAHCDANGLVVLTELDIEKILHGVAARPVAEAAIEVRELRTKLLEAIGRTRA